MCPALLARVRRYHGGRLPGAIARSATDQGSLDRGRLTCEMSRPSAADVLAALRDEQPPRDRLVVAISDQAIVSAGVANRSQIVLVHKPLTTTRLDAATLGTTSAAPGSLCVASSADRVCSGHEAGPVG
jgi:hypothetical protein